MPESTRRHDFIVVGAGSAGYAAARTARDVGCDVALIDHGPLGGLCILRGCMPSKALLASSDALADARDAGILGIHAGTLTADMPFIAARKRDLVRGFAEYRIEGIEEFPLYHGAARFLSPTQIEVGDDVLEALALRDRDGKRRVAAGSARAERNRLSRQRRGARFGSDPVFGHRFGWRIYGVRARSVSVANGLRNDDADSKRARPHLGGRRRRRRLDRILAR